MRRTASEIIRNLEVRVARLERRATRPLNDVALELIKKRWKDLNKGLARTRSGIEMKKPLHNAPFVLFYVKGFEGVLELHLDRQNENLFEVDHVDDYGVPFKSSTMDVNEFISPNTNNPNTDEINDWDLPQPQALANLLLRGLNKHRVF